MQHEKNYDVIVIGLGPAGMAVSIMASELGLSVCGIEARALGGECMNVGCIPSKALLHYAAIPQHVRDLRKLGLTSSEEIQVKQPFAAIHDDLGYIGSQKTKKMFNKVEVVMGRATFVNATTVEVNGLLIKAKKIFICTGTRPEIPDLPGLSEISLLTNENLFDLREIPEELVILGGGAIACEMAQAFARLGSKVSMVIRGASILWREDRDAVAILQAKLVSEGVKIYPNQGLDSFKRIGSKSVVVTDAGQEISGNYIVAALGRKMDYSDLNLPFSYSGGRIEVNRYLQTEHPNIYAVGDCNGYRQFTHAAMHQGMIALINSMVPKPFKRNFKKYVVPWTIFTTPQFSHVGPRFSELSSAQIYQTSYSDYGASIAQKFSDGFVKIAATKTGRVLAATVIGEGSGEMIQQWSLTIQEKIPLYKHVFLQHSFPTMSFLNKRVAEEWMMARMPMFKGLAQRMYRFFS